MYNDYMRYKLYIKNPGVNIKILKEFDFPEKIVDFYFYEKLLILTNGSLYQLELENIKPEKVTDFKFKNASSFNYKDGSVYLADNGGREIYIINERNKLCRLFIDGLNKSIIDNLLKKHNGQLNCVVIGVNLGKAYLLIRELNRIFLYENSSLNCIAGNGFAGYSVGPTAKTSMLNHPEGICVHLGKIFVSDTGNGVIRLIENNKMRVFAGHPIDNRILAERITVCRDMLYFNGNTGVRAINLDGGKPVFDILKTEKRTMINTDLDKKCLYILEENE